MDTFTNITNLLDSPEIKTQKENFDRDILKMKELGKSDKEITIHLTNIIQAISLCLHDLES